ncbi:MAG TPA: glycosyltransferase family 4 protein [Stellaceae bacterium]|nr:glycosyltransferase family 4 protein [Stellaceae bacterium]
MSDIAFIVPGALDQLTGGYLFDRHIVDGLRRAGRKVTVHELAGTFPDTDATAQRAAAAALAAIADKGAAVIDGLALPAFIECLPREAARLKLVAFVHHPLALETGLAAETGERFAAIEMRLLPRLAGVLCPSAITAWAVEDYGVPHDRIAITPPGTDKPATMPRRAPRDGPVHLLSIGSLTPRKGHLLLIDALSELKDRAWRLRCIGSLTRDPQTVAAVRRAIADHGLDDRVELIGEWPPERLGAAYAEADVFVLASYHEGYGMAFAEALAHGLPIVGTTAGAIPETVPASASLLVPPGDGDALTASLRLVLDNPTLRLRLAAGAAAAGAALPDWPAATRHWMAAFDRLVA